MTTPTLLLVAGPTAVGKTEICLRLARDLGTEILSADSRQCYQEMNIGTAKPTPAERAAIPHHLIDYLSVTTPYTAAAYASDARALLEELGQRHPLLLLAGGSGLYIDALCQGLSPLPPTPPALRQQLQEELRCHGLPALAAELAACDPPYAARCDLRNPRRVLRALEVYRTSGKTLTEWQRIPPPPPPFRVVKTALCRPAEELYARINSRARRMVEEGLAEEVETLYPLRHYPALQTLGYQEFFSVLEGKRSVADALTLLQRNTRHYAKRQLSWLRRDPHIRWYHPRAYPRLLEEVKQAMGKQESP